MKRGKTTRSRTVLLVEDNADHAELLSDVLQEGFSPLKIHSVNSFDDAVELVSHNSYNLVCLDAFLNNRSVIDDLPSLCSLAGEAPVIVFAGSGDEALAAVAIKNGAAEYFVKNRETLQTLLHRLKKYLRGRLVKPAKGKSDHLVKRLVRETASLTRKMQKLATGGKGTHMTSLLHQIEQLHALMRKENILWQSRK